MKKIFLLLLAFVLILSCSADDAANSIDQNGGEIFRSQVVTVTMSSVTLLDNEYQGTLDGAAITLTKSEDSKLLFLVPYATTIGLHDLVIPSLDNATIHYDVKNTVLSETPEVTMAPFLANLNTFSQTLDASPEAAAVQHTIDSFNAVFTNASAEDKTTMAILYKSNNAIFNDLILNDFSSVTDRTIDPNDVVTLAKHSAAVYLMAAGAIVAIAEPTKIGVVVGGVLVAVGAYKARAYFLVLLERKLNCINLSLNGLFGNNDRNATATALTFQNQVSSIIPFNTVDRGLIAADSGKTQPGAVSFFKVYNRYNYFVNKLNSIIIWVNNNIAFADFRTIPTEQLAVTNPLVNTQAGITSFSHFTFSVNHPDLVLQSVYPINGSLDIKINFVNTPATVPVESFLYYSYNDSFSSFSGKIPITVIPTFMLIGTWNLESYGGVPLGTNAVADYYVNCSPMIVRTYIAYVSETLTFNGAYSGTMTSQNSRIKTDTRVFAGSDCILTMDYPDEMTPLSSSSNVSFTLNQRTLKTVGISEDYFHDMRIISPNKIGITYHYGWEISFPLSPVFAGEFIYVRQ
ncbi:hypothetical protein [Flavobacterium sp. GT3R68]|uniref:hypothetical protein n=1 Tax=Flavobacterium sp. GT3R68 TaxID=2594437 RepID=UPI000F888660|nr:hypothetical protein [Flavobacterium sp. GT3R68]RTY92469.1 hypothetical protein EKL32_16830 [Flavobacterium sp. GSN2]TRW94094.1 hypothetical protein FNW07_04045 [Flavobacterium sp. GT3R68]